jgi:VIT1/CCC1 family predicted Fe2+/Mn2+ transporter
LQPRRRNTKAVLIAGASGAVAAAVSMMAGAYLDVETTRDEIEARRSLIQSVSALNAFSVSLPSRLRAAGLTQEQSAALAGGVQHDRAALGGLLMALEAPREAPRNPWEQALWMLIADFLAAAVPILPFVFLPIPQARIISGIVTIALLVGLGIGRPRIAKHNAMRTVAETVAIGITAALAGIVVGLLIDHGFGG